MKMLMKMRKLATVPLRTDDRNAPLVVGTPRSEQVAKKTENAENAKIIFLQWKGLELITR